MFGAQIDNGREFSSRTASFNGGPAPELTNILIIGGDVDSDLDDRFKLRSPGGERGAGRRRCQARPRWGSGGPGSHRCRPAAPGQVRSSRHWAVVP